jgi:hypothetical protein
LHFARGLFRKRNGQNAFWIDAVPNQLGDAIRDDARFASPRAGQD